MGNYQRMTQRSVLITGCSSGIGLCCARTLVARGWRVFASARRPADVAKLQAEDLEALQLDLDDSDSIAAAVTDVLQRSGGTLDALFNNGAYGLPGAVEDLSRAALRAQFETNLFGWLELTNRVIPVMRAQGHGRIVMNSSVLGFVALPYRGAYTATKFALEGISDTLRMELAGSGIHVSLIEPGPIDTQFRANAHAAFKRWIAADCSAHKIQYVAQERRLTSTRPGGAFTQSADAVCAKLIHALESRRPRARYRVTVPTHLFAWLKRILPSGVLDCALRRAGGGGAR